MKIGGIQKTTLTDYPEKVAAIIFTQGCNFNCGFCHNPELVHQTFPIFNMSEEEVIEFLTKRKKVLDGLTITGGEPTLYDDLPDFIKKVKQLGYAVKLDTNGTNPNMIEDLIAAGLVDYLAMDVKSTLDKYSQVAGTKVKTADIKKNIDLMLDSGLDHEFRTTLIKNFHTDNEAEIIASQVIAGAKRYFLQKFSNRNKVLDPSFQFKQPFTDKEMEAMAKKCQQYVNYCGIR